MTTQTKAQIIWLDPECNEWDRREWESLWSMDELQNGNWNYLGSVYVEDQWIHQFEKIGNFKQQLHIQAYSLWRRLR